MINYKSQGRFAAISFLVGERISRLLIGFFVHAWMARSLSPEDFGFISYVVKVVSSYYAFGLFGNDELIIHELINADNLSKKDVLFTIRKMRLLIGLIGWVVMLIITGLASGFGTEIWLWMLLFGVTIPLQALTVYELPFMSQMFIKPLFILRSSSYLLGTILKSFALILKLSKGAFVGVYLIEEACWKFFAFAIASINNWNGGKYKNEIVELIFKASFLSFVANFIMLFDQRVAFLIIDHTGDKNLLAHFSVVISLIEIVLLIPIAISSAIYPSVVAAKNSNNSQYEKSKIVLSSSIVWCSIFFAASSYFLGPYMINLVYKGKYSAVIPAFQGMAVVTIFSFFNFGRFKWFVLDKSLNDWIALLFLGLVFQSLALYLLLPSQGLMSVVYAVLAGHLFSNGLLIFRPSIKESWKIFLKSLNPANLFLS
jgi:PST family polysaccharide transporter